MKVKETEKVQNKLTLFFQIQKNKSDCIPKFQNKFVDDILVSSCHISFIRHGLRVSDNLEITLKKPDTLKCVITPLSIASDHKITTYWLPASFIAHTYFKC